MADLSTVANVADELTNPIRVREPIHYWDANRNRKTRYHTTTAPSLLRQLHLAIYPGLMYVEDTGGQVHRAPGSAPAARVDAMNACLTIEAAAAHWVIKLGLSIRQTTESNIRALVGANTDSDTTADILTEMRRWYGQAATLTGWERPPWRPNAPCPLCARTGGLRVRLDRHSAVCTDCGEAWTPLTIGLLAEHLNAMTERKPGTDHLRTLAVLARRTEEAQRARLAATPRPDLPYLLA